MTTYNFTHKACPAARGRVSKAERECLAVEAAIRRLNQLDPVRWPIDAAMEQRLQDERARFTERRQPHGQVKRHA